MSGSTRYFLTGNLLVL